MAVGIISGVLVVMGLISAGVGAIVARHTVRTAQKSYRRTASLSPATLEGWDDWFLNGFSGLTVGIRWLTALGIWLAWTIAGIGCVWLGLRLINRI